MVEYEDRLARFGYSYLKEFAVSFNVAIEAVENVGKLNPMKKWSTTWSVSLLVLAQGCMVQEGAERLSRRLCKP
ncbi:hypothetical protein [Desulfosporosinus lacus]|uniref:hypothetical protein n=1 Tax=Desulfosporosinus lacus TaxID=329936 RepID=UPI001A9A485E|nr:hypothetical protein [Desulfosporosinus lacus]